MSDEDAIEPMKLGQVKLLSFFTGYLDRIYCAKSHLVERLPELADQAHFKDLRHAVTETLEDVENQIVRMDEIYRLINARPSIARCNGLVSMVEDAYSDIHEHGANAELRDLSILFYMQGIESVEAACFQVLQLAAVKLKNERIKQLLRENFDEAKADRALFLLITTKYITS